MANIKNKPHLEKDISSGAIMNTDESAYRQAKLAKQKILSEMKEKEELLERMDKLESLVESLIKSKGK